MKRISTVAIVLLLIGGLSVNKEVKNILQNSGISELFVQTAEAKNWLNFRIFYNVPNDATFKGETPQASNKEEKVKLHTDIPERPGYAFEGWRSSKGTHMPGSVIDVDGDIYLEAMWKKLYTIRYDALGGSGAPESQTKTHGEPEILSLGIPTKEGHTFKHWSVGPIIAAKTVYNPGEIYTEDVDLTLYAIWEPLKYEIKYDANGGSGAPESQTKKYGETITLSSVKPTRPGYDFYKWSIYKKSNPDAVANSLYNPGDEYSNNESVTLYADWEPKTYEITYDANKGSGAPSSDTKTHGIDFTLSSEEPTRTGYGFAGWSRIRNATTASYKAGSVYQDNRPATLYAVWKKGEYILTVGDDEINGKYDETVVIEAPEVSYEITYQYNGGKETVKTNTVKQKFLRWKTPVSGKIYNEESSKTMYTFGAKSEKIEAIYGAV